MSRDRNKTTKALAVRPETSAYEVGYGKPPVSTRFKPGQSGNPAGRPKGSKNRSKSSAPHEERLNAIILEEAYRTVSIQDANGQVTISMTQAVVRALAVNAAKGNLRAQRLFTELVASVERDNRRRHEELLEAAIAYKARWERELERREWLGVSAPDPVPHPDHIVIDMSTGAVEVKGPMTNQEKALWDKARERRIDCDEEIRRLEAMLKEDPDNQALKDDLERERRIREITLMIAPD